VAVPRHVRKDARWTDADLDALSDVSAPADQQEATAAWRQDAPEAAKDLLDAEEED